jgi:hypothetical protein
MLKKGDEMDKVVATFFWVAVFLSKLVNEITSSEKL